MKKIHELVHRLHNSDLAILFVRLAIGIPFINAGLLKFQNMDMVISGFASMGLPVFVAYLVAYCEFIGGIVVVLGIFVRYAGVILAIIMISAISMVHIQNGYSLANGGYEYTLLLLFLGLSLLTSGAGKYSIAGWLRRRKEGQIQM